MTTLDVQYDELKLRREDKRLQAEIKRLKAIPGQWGVRAGLIAAVVTGYMFPISLAGFVGAVGVSVLLGLITMGVLYFIVAEDILWYERRRSELRRPLRKTKAA